MTVTAQTFWWKMRMRCSERLLNWSWSLMPDSMEKDELGNALLIFFSTIQTNYDNPWK